GLELLLRLAPARRRRLGALLAGGREAHHAGALVLAGSDRDQLVARERLHRARRRGAVHHHHVGERADRLRAEPQQLGKNGVLRRLEPLGGEVAVVDLARVPRRLAQRQAVADRRLRHRSSGLVPVALHGPHSKSVHTHPCLTVHMHLFSCDVKRARSPMDPRTRKLLEAPIVPTLLRLAAPNVTVMVMQAAVGLIETYFVGKLGTDALAGVALVFPLLMVIQMISAGAMGGGILSGVARALGSGRRDDANVLPWHALPVPVRL